MNVYKSKVYEGKGAFFDWSLPSKECACSLVAPPCTKMWIAVSSTRTRYLEGSLSILDTHTDIEICAKVGLPAPVSQLFYGRSYRVVEAHDCHLTN